MNTKSLISVLLGSLVIAAVSVSTAQARDCFGEPARVIRSSGVVKVKHGQTVELRNRKRVKVNAAGANLICAKGGPVDLTLGGGGSSEVRLGSGDDKVRLVGEIKRTERRTIWTGLGNDDVTVTGRGNTITYLSPKKVKRGARDTDTYSGNQDIDTVYDYGGGTDERPNVIKGNRALDYLHSAGTARTDIYGGDGTDYLYALSRGDGRDRLFGDRGNDRLDGRGAKKSNGIYMDGAEGDDWYYGSAGPDTMLSLSGVKKMRGNGGDDTFIRSSYGKSTIYGGPGHDTLSYKAHIPPGWNKRWNGMYISMGSTRKEPGNAAGGDKGEDPVIASVEHVIGSAFNDYIVGRGNTEMFLDGGPGDDFFIAYYGNNGDGGLGENLCGPKPGTTWSRCDPETMVVPQADEAVLELDSDGVPVILGTDRDDDITLSYLAGREAFQVEIPGKVLMSGSCSTTESEGTYVCPVDPDLLSVAVVSAGSGNDQINLEGIPEHMNVIADGGAGTDRIQGDYSREVTFNLELGNLAGGNDQIWMTEDSTLNAGPGSDTVHMTVMCVGGNVKGGPGVRDGIVFAGLKRGVWASMAAHKARYLKGPCPKPFRFADDWEGLEGTREDDVLIGSNTKGITFLGRDGIDVFKARNGKFDKITVGGGGHRNKVIADKKDRIHWDWGYAAF